MSRPQFVRGEPCGCHPELRQWRQGWPVSQLNMQNSCFFARSVPGRHRSQYLRSLHRTIQSRYTAQTFQSSHAVKQEARMFATADKARFVLQYIQKCRSCMFLPLLLTRQLCDTRFICPHVSPMRMLHKRQRHPLCVFTNCICVARIELVSAPLGQVTMINKFGRSSLKHSLVDCTVD